MPNPCKAVKLSLLAAVIATLSLSHANAQPPGTFVSIGDMTTARSGHTATLLGDGRVLIAGGSATAEIYDPASRTFARTGSMAAFRRGHSATLLADGKVLIAGGAGLATAEIYDPVTGTFSPTGSMLEDQLGHSATLLSNGKVLIAGGERSAPPFPTVARAELYDPATGTFSYAGPYAGEGPVWPKANALPDGRVLIVGEGRAELFDPSTETFVMTGAMAEKNYSFTFEWEASTSLLDGRVLVTGGNDDMTCGGFDSAEIYDPAAGTFSATGGMITPRDIHTATLLRDGTVLIAGGGEGWCFSPTLASAELFDPASRSFISAGSMMHSRSMHTATLLPDGDVLITGGISYWPYTVLRSAELYQPASGTSRRRVAHH